MLEWLQYKVQHYHPVKYWRYREKVVGKESHTPKFLKYYYLYRIKKSDAFNNASMGTNLGKGAQFKTPPVLPHGLNGIIISYYAKIRKECVIRQQVTLAQNDQNEAPTIGDFVVIGAGAKIIGNVHIGDRAIIGANAVVTHDVEADTTVGGVPARVISRREGPYGS